MDEVNQKKWILQCMPIACQTAGDNAYTWKTIPVDIKMYTFSQSSSGNHILLEGTISQKVTAVPSNADSYVENFSKRLTENRLKRRTMKFISLDDIHENVHVRNNVSEDHEGIKTRENHWDKSTGSGSKKFFLGTFATGIPDFHSKYWWLQRERETIILKDETGRRAFSGLLALYKGTSYAHYIEPEGTEQGEVSSLSAWYTFKKIPHHEQLTLKQAEERMEGRRTALERLARKYKIPVEICDEEEEYDSSKEEGWLSQSGKEMQLLLERPDLQRPDAIHGPKEE